MHYSNASIFKKIVITQLLSLQRHLTSKYLHIFFMTSRNKCSFFNFFTLNGQRVTETFIKKLGLQVVSALVYKEGGATLQSSAPSTKYMGESLFVLTCCSSCIAHLFSVQQYVKTTNRQGMHAILFVLCMQLEAIQLSRVLKSKVVSWVIYRYWYFLY